MVGGRFLLNFGYDLFSLRKARVGAGVCSAGLRLAERTDFLTGDVGRWVGGWCSPLCRLASG